MTRLLSGIPVRDKILHELKKLVSSANPAKVPKLSIIQIGNNPASSSYVKGKAHFGKEIGIVVDIHHFEEDVPQEKVLALVDVLNSDASVGGIIIQLPLPPHIDKEGVISAIDPEKDVDGLHPYNQEKRKIIPATARAIMSLVDYYNINLVEKKVLVIGRSALVGAPTAEVCRTRGAFVTSAHKGTSDIQGLAKASDIIIVATGAAGLITKEYVKKEHIIIDVGITRKDGGLVGDVDFSEVFPLVEAITPVPGGVGPLTIASLFQNLLRKYT